MQDYLELPDVIKQNEDEFRITEDTVWLREKAEKLEERLQAVRSRFKRPEKEIEKNLPGVSNLLKRRSEQKQKVIDKQEAIERAKVDEEFDVAEAYETSMQKIYKENVENLVMKQVERGKSDQYRDVFKMTVDNEEAGITPADVATLEEYERLLYKQNQRALTKVDH